LLDAVRGGSMCRWSYFVRFSIGRCGHSVGVGITNSLTGPFPCCTDVLSPGSRSVWPGVPCILRGSTVHNEITPFLLTVREYVFEGDDFLLEAYT